MRTAVLVAVLAAVLFLPIGRAGTAIRLDIEGLVQHAELVFEGRVVSTQTYQTSSGLVETEYFVSVHRSYLGDPFGTQVFRMPGGTLADGSGMVIPGMPAVEAGDDALFFLTEVGTTGWRVPVGLAQGKFALTVSPDGRRALERSSVPLNLVDPVTGAPMNQSSQASAMLGYQETVLRIENAVARKLLDTQTPATPGEDR